MSLQSQQIVTLAMQIAKCNFATQAGQLLNAILEELAMVYDFDVIKATSTISVTGGSSKYNLPSDYLRNCEVFYSINGAIFYLNQIPLELYDVQFQGSGITSYPENYATDMESSPPVIYFYPPPNVSLSMTLRYYKLPADISTPESSVSVAWFPMRGFLIKRLAADLMALTGDNREQVYRLQSEKMLNDYLMSKDDKQGFAQTVALDPLFFRGVGSLKPTKAMPF